MKKICICLGLVVCSVRVFAQSTPVTGLESQLKLVQQDTIRLRILKKLADQYQYKAYAKAYSYAQQGLALALKDKLNTDACKFYETLGNLSRLKNDDHRAFYYFGKELALAQQTRSALSIVLSYRDLGLAYQAKSKFTDAQANFMKALNVSESAPGHPRIALIYEDIASIYDNENQLAKATAYVQKAMQIINKRDTLALEKGLELKGVIAYQQGHAKEARGFHQEALKLYQLQEDSVGEATMFMQIASTYDGSYRNAQHCLTYCLRSKAIWDKTNPGSVYALYNMDNLAMAYWNMVQFLDTMRHTGHKKSLQQVLAAKAQRSFEEAYHLSKTYSNGIAALFALNELAKVESYQGNKDAAYQNMRLYNSLHDSIYSQQNVNKIAELEDQRAIDLRDKQLQIKQLQIANDHKQAILLIGSVATLICIALVIFFRSRHRKRVNGQLSLLNKELEAANAVKNKFFGILNHDLKRPVADLVTLQRLQKSEPGLIDEAKREQHEAQIAASAEHLLATMEELLLWSKGQMENFEPQIQYVPVRPLFDYIKRSFEPGKVVLHFEDQDGLKIYTDEHYLKTIMLNLTNNALHALVETPSPRIAWAATQDEMHSYLTITDNGPGASDQQLRPLYDDTVPVGIKSGLGLHIIRDLAKAINCKIELDQTRTSGMKITIKIPKTRPQ